MEIDVVIPTLDKNSENFKDTFNSTKCTIEKAGCKANFIIIGPEIIGRGRARDVGWRKGNAPFVLNIDTGIVLPLEWFEIILKAKEDIGGEVWYGNDSKSGNPSNLIARCSEIGAMEYVNRLSKKGRYVDMPSLNTSNCLFTRRVLEEVQGFDVNLPFCEDSDIGHRIWKKGFRITFVPDAKCTNIHRDTLYSKLKQSWNFGVGSFYIRNKDPSFPFKLLMYVILPYSILKRIIFWGFKYGVDGVLASFVYFLKRIAFIMGYFHASRSKRY